MKANRESGGSTRYDSADSPPRRVGPIDLTGNSSSDGSPEIQIVRKTVPAAPRYVAPPAQQPRAPAGPAQQSRQSQLPFKPLPALQNSDPRFNRTPPESPTSYNNRQNALKSNNPLPPPPRPFASSSTAFNTVNSAKQNAFNSMQAQHTKMGIPALISVPKVGYTPPLTAAELVAKAARLSLTSVKKADDGVKIVPPAPYEYLDQAASELALRELVEATCDFENVDMSEAMPENMPGCTLLPHQVQGVYWLRDREAGKKHGGILADDMGLGKTIQMIALICANTKKTKSIRSKATLVVCPVSLMSQWESEIKSKTRDGLTVYIHHGPNRTKDSRKLERYDVVITSYNTAVSEWLDPKPKKVKKGAAPPKRVAKVKDESGPLFEAEFYRIILDEAHVIKDRSTKMHKACCELQGYYRWCLTGTPIQNTIQDLHSLFEFLGPIVKPMHDFSVFKEKILLPIKAGRPKTAMDRLSVILRGVLLRRTKNTMVNGKPLITLPGREVRVITVPFSDQKEREFYDAVAKKMNSKMDALVKAGTVTSNYTNVLIALLRMRQATSHPSLVGGFDADALEPAVDESLAIKDSSQKTDDSNDLDDLIGGLNKLAVGNSEEVEKKGTKCALCESIAKVGGAYCQSCDAEMAKYRGLKFSTKIRHTMRILGEIREEKIERKTIIFSQFTSMFDLLEPFIKKSGIKFVRFDGKMNKVQKEAALESIRRDRSVTVILISLKCGSVGLNLTACSRVILLDLWWNPAIEQQAFDRSHRFGQTEDVVIYKLTIETTVEDRLLELQAKKSADAASALDGGDHVKSNKLSMADIMFLFRGDGNRGREE